MDDYKNHDEAIGKIFTQFPGKDQVVIYIEDGRQMKRDRRLIEANDFVIDLLMKAVGEKNVSIVAGRI